MRLVAHAKAGLVAVVVGAAACESSLGVGVGGGPGGGSPDPVATLPAGLSQQVTLSPESPVAGADFVVRSVLRNDTTVVMPITSRICGLNWGGTLRVSAATGGPACEGFSMVTALAPGDSVVGSARWRILSPAGNYTLYVGHLVTPNYGHALPITVVQ